MGFNLRLLELLTYLKGVVLFWTVLIMSLRWDEIPNRISEGKPAIRDKISQAYATK